MWLWLIQNILGSISVIIWPMMAISSAAVILLSRVLESLPQVKMFSYLVKSIAFALFTIALFLWGAAGVNSIYVSQIKEMEIKVADAESRSYEINKQLEEKITEKANVIHEVHTVFKTKIKEIAVKIDKDCKVDRSAINALNSIATGANP